MGSPRVGRGKVYPIHGALSARSNPVAVAAQEVTWDHRTAWEGCSTPPTTPRVVTAVLCVPCSINWGEMGFFTPVFPSCCPPGWGLTARGGAGLGWSTTLDMSRYIHLVHLPLLCPPTGRVRGDFSLIATNFTCYQGCSLSYSCWQLVTHSIHGLKSLLCHHFWGCPWFCISRDGASQQMASNKMRPAEENGNMKDTVESMGHHGGISEPGFV